MTPVHTLNDERFISKKDSGVHSTAPNLLPLTDAASRNSIVVDSPAPAYTRYPPSYQPANGAYDFRIVQQAAETNTIPSYMRLQEVDRGQLRRGLQIPTKRTTISSGFTMPPLLAKCGVDEAKWDTFQKEIKNHGSLSGKQWAYNVASSWGVGVLIGAVVPFAALFVAIPFSYSHRKKYEFSNFKTAIRCGGIETCLQRWNTSYFEPLGIYAAIESPGVGDLSSSDVASTKLSRYQASMGIESNEPGTASNRPSKKELKYQGKEVKARVKAAQKARIVIMPLQMVQSDPIGHSQSNALGLRTANMARDFGG
ncbi:MAG: hypothetical protein Q9164_001168 [Protoblastenia rupestris]